MKIVSVIALMLVLVVAAITAQQGNINWTQIRLSDAIPLPGNAPLVVKLTSGHTANGFCVQNTGGTNLFCVDKDGNALITGGNKVQISGAGGGRVQMSGATSGSVTLAVPATAGTNTITLPASTGTLALKTGVTVTGSCCTITAITEGIITAATCVP